MLLLKMGDEADMTILMQECALSLRSTEAG